MSEDRLATTIEILKNERECVSRDCDRDCEKCELVREQKDILDAYDDAIYRLEQVCKMKVKLQSLMQRFPR